MTDKEVRKLRKKALMEILLEQTKENERLNEEIALLKSKLNDKEIMLQNAGTIAEAAFEMNGVLAAAEAAAQQYLNNVKNLTERQEMEIALKEKTVAAKCIAQEQATFERCNFMKEEAEKACAEMEAAAKSRCEMLEAETKARCEQKEKEAKEHYAALTKKAEEDVEAKWTDLSARLEDFYRAHTGLKNLLTADAMVQRNS